MKDSTEADLCGAEMDMKDLQHQKYLQCNKVENQLG